eukprot:12902677-Prorocentrum_lima.AAC.1
MEEPDSHDQDMIHEAFIQDLAAQLEDAIVPLLAPPGELVQIASSGHAGVGEPRTRSPTPMQRTPPSPRERTTAP